MQRRTFIKNACMICAGTTALAAIISACGAPLNIYKPVSTSGIINVPVSAFGTGNYIIVRSQKLDYDIFISRTPESEYTGILMKCTHRDAPVRYSSGGLVCNEHGSRFDFNGKVTKSPATKDLRRINITSENDNLLINLNSI